MSDRGSIRLAVAGVIGLVVLTPATAFGVGRLFADEVRAPEVAAISVPVSAVATGERGVPAATPQPTAPTPVRAALRAADLTEEDAIQPVRITIEAIGIDAPIGPVGVDDEGFLDVFDDVERVGWYRHGPTPGGAGSAVLAAHVDHWRDGAGVFYRLRELGKGEMIVLHFDDGSARRFVVAGLQRHPRDALPTRELFRRTGAPVVTLITCGGRFDDVRRSYDENVVVQAVPA